MKIYFDTEFQGLELVSIGMVSDAGTYYAETGIEITDKWLEDHVAPSLSGIATPIDRMWQEIVSFAGERPEFYAWYGAYDWVLLCELFGGLLNLPPTWPRIYRECRLLIETDDLPYNEHAHNALSDAKWLKTICETHLGH